MSIQPHLSNSRNESDQRSINILHLSDLHFNIDTPFSSLRGAIMDDLRNRLGCTVIDFLVISGDFIDSGKVDAFVRASSFIEDLVQRLPIEKSHCIFVPGNHDIQEQVYPAKRSFMQRAQDFVGRTFTRSDSATSRVVDDVDEKRYEERFLRYSDFCNGFFKDGGYPLSYKEQGRAHLFCEHKLVFLELNSCRYIDQRDRHNASVDMEALQHSFDQVEDKIRIACEVGELDSEQGLLRIAVCHHPLIGHGEIRDRIIRNSKVVMERLRDNKVGLYLHGDIHQMHRAVETSTWSSEKLYISGCGAIGDPEASQRMYSLIQIPRNGHPTTVHVRFQQRPNGRFSSWNQALEAGDVTNNSSFYTLDHFRFIHD